MLSDKTGENEIIIQKAGVFLLMLLSLDER
jgi:hypothetical protein